ncbi:MAG: ABC-type amino acid transport substrate-binding protein, partial [Planctomycetota bacterium]
RGSEPNGSLPLVLPRWILSWLRIAAWLRIAVRSSRQVVGCDPGTTGVSAVKSRLPNATLLTERTDQRSWGEWLVTGDIDAVIIDASHAETFMKNAGTRFHVIEEPLAKERFGIAMQPGAKELHDAINAAIQRKP